MKTILASLLIFITLGAFAQGAKISDVGGIPDPSAGLDIDFTDKGILIPRLTEAQRLSLNNPAHSLMIYQTDSDAGYYLNYGTPSVPDWRKLVMSPANGALDMGSHTINNLKTPTTDHQAATKVYVDTTVANAVAASGGSQSSTMTFSLNLDKATVSVGVNDTSDNDPLEVRVQLTGGSPAPVVLELTGVPAGVTYSLSPGGGFPEFNASVIFYTSSGAVGGSYSITVTATGGSANQTASFTLDVVPKKRVFLSDAISASGGNLGGLAGADAQCQSQANAASLGGNWVAWLSTSAVDAKDRITNAAYYRLDGVLIAHSRADLLDGTLENAVRLTPTGQYTGAWAFTGTNSDGTASQGYNLCNDWTSTSGTTVVGDPDSYNNSSGWWTNRTSTNCNAVSYRLYCFEN